MLKRISILFIGALLFGCAQTTPKDSAGAKPGFQIKSYQEISLPNGLRLLLIADQALPRVSLGLMVQAGSIHDPLNQWGLASFTGSMLENGTKSRKAMKLADEFGQIASEISISVGSEETIVSASTIASEKDQLLELVSDCILNPAFEEKEINRERAQVLAAIQKRQDNPSHYADILIEKETYGSHPYAHPGSGEIESVKSFQQKDLQAFYKKYYSPKNSILYVTGAFDEAYVGKIKSSFSNWKGEGSDTWQALPFKSVVAQGIKLFTKPDLKQAQIRFAERGIKRTDPDYLALKLANVVLGGDFVSRLNLRVRDQLGLTYSIHSALNARLDNGDFEISTFSRNEKIGETIAESRKVIKAFVDKGVTAAELEAAKALISGQFPAAIETTDKLAYNLLLLRLYGVSDDYLKDFISNLNAVSLEQVNAAIQKHLIPENFRVVVFADQSLVIDQLKALGPVEVEQVKQ